jgi:hypothetical protein
MTVIHRQDKILDMLVTIYEGDIRLVELPLYLATCMFDAELRPLTLRQGVSF